MTDKTADFPDDLVDVESDEMAFHMKRDNPQPGRTFSEEAFTAFTGAITKYISSRVIRHWKSIEDKAKPGPQDIKVIVRVSVDDAEPVLVPDDEYPWFAIDGELRKVN